MSGARPGRDARLVGAAGAVAAVLFIALFRLQRLGPLDFWAWLSLNIVIVVAMGFVLDRGYARRLRERPPLGLRPEKPPSASPRPRPFTASSPSAASSRCASSPSPRPGSAASTP